MLEEVEKRFKGQPPLLHPVNDMKIAVRMALGIPVRCEPWPNSRAHAPCRSPVANSLNSTLTLPLQDPELKKLTTRLETAEHEIKTHSLHGAEDVAERLDAIRRKHVRLGSVQWVSLPPRTCGRDATVRTRPDRVPLSPFSHLHRSSESRPRR